MLSKKAVVGFALALVVLGAAAIGVYVALAPAPPSAPPNVVVIILDTVRDDAVGMNWAGTPLTPEVDRITREGTRFTAAYTPGPWTVPSHASLFTGLYPHEHLAQHGHFNLRKDAWTLAECLQAEGYETVGVTCNPWLHAKSGFEQGFDRYAEVYRKLTADKGATHASDLVIEWLEQRADDGRPFFLFINYLEAHLPYGPPADVLATLPRNSTAPPRASVSISLAEQYIMGREPLSDADLAEIRRVYSAAVAYQDKQVGRVLDHLRRMGGLDHTLLFVTADHAEHLGENGLMGHEFSVHEPVLRVPLIVRCPGVFPAQAQNATPVSHVDLLPTVLDVLGLDAADRSLPGTSLRQISSEPCDPLRPVLAEYATPTRLVDGYWGKRYPDYDMSARRVSLRAVQIGEYKYIIDGRGNEQLFRIAGPEGRLERAIAPNAQHLADLRARLAELTGTPGG